MRISITILFLFLFTGCAGIKPGLSGKSEQPTNLDFVLEELYLERTDLTIPYDTSSQDPFLLKKIPLFLSSPLQTLTYSKQIDHDFRSSSAGLSSMVDTCRNIMEIEVEETVLPEISSIEKEPDINLVIQTLYDAISSAKKLIDEAFENLERREIDFVRETIEQLLFYGRHNENLSRRRNQELIENAFQHAANIDLVKIGEAAYCIASALDDIMPVLPDVPWSHDSPQMIDTELGRIVIGGNGDDMYTGDIPLLLIDFEGNDTYRFENHAPISLIVDSSGDDTYDASGGGLPGSGIMGIGVLTDSEGNDTYYGNNFSFGCGFLGAGILHDAAGNDRYVSHMFSQGAAAFGIGLLYDEEGDDFYQTTLYGQGMGYVGGAGVLADMTGDDSFISKNSVPDSREKEDAYQTYSQGFGLGCRLYASGGVGVLYNGEGNDTYRGSYFCQGSSYWHALGMLIDRNGSDRYFSRRYSQGSGVHSSVGILMDCKGNDSFNSWGVSQGCGHDYSAGILNDQDGDDVYESEWLSQGAGNSTGIGLFIDDNGNDRYKTKNNDSTLGSGVYDTRRDTESIGIFIDRQGEDIFLPPPDQEILWKRGKTGGGIDSDGSSASAWQLPLDTRSLATPLPLTKKEVPIKTDPLEVELLPELEASLFLEKSWEAAAEALAQKGPRIIPLLLHYLDIKDVPVRRTVEETIKKLGEDYLQDIHDTVIHENTRPHEKKFLLYVLGDIEKSVSKYLFLEYLTHENSAIQAMAIRGLYKLKEPPPIELLEKIYNIADSAAKKYLALALQSSNREEELDILCRLLTDENFQVRHAAYRSLKEINSQAVLPLLEHLRSETGLLPSVYNMADDLIDSLEQ